ncbi:hypothetical protein P9112_014568 [Eukaryota sp. TZLM1-RC]
MPPSSQLYVKVNQELSSVDPCQNFKRLQSNAEIPAFVRALVPENLTILCEDNVFVNVDNEARTAFLLHFHQLFIRKGICVLDEQLRLVIDRLRAVEASFNPNTHMVVPLRQNEHFDEECLNLAKSICHKTEFHERFAYSLYLLLEGHSQDELLAPLSDNFVTDLDRISRLEHDVAELKSDVGDLKDSMSRVLELLESRT